MPETRPRGMESFFEPRSVAVAGVSTDPNKLGSIIFANLLANEKNGALKASVYALNPTHDFIGDQRCYPSIGALPEVPELLIVAVPESQTEGLIEAAAKSGIRAAVIVTSGYAETGRGDAEHRIAKFARRGKMRILGPNTIGLLDTRSGVDSLFLRPTKTLPDGSKVVSMVRPMEGDIAVITQSGHLGETVSEELAANGVGIRALVGTGNQLDVSVEDVIQYFADDPHTKVMAIYVEGLRDGRRFMRVAAHASKRKPIVIFKVGKTSVGARAALTHTASLVGDYDVYRAAFQQSGVIEAQSLQELVDYAVSLSMLGRTPGNRLAIVTNAGGVGAIAADEAVKQGLKVEPLGQRAERKLRSEFDPESFVSNSSLANPIDLTASVTTDEFVRVTRSVLTLPEFDLVLVMPTHQAPGMDYDIAEKLAEVISKGDKSVAMAVIGTSELARRIHREFMAKGIPSFPTPERAVHALAAAPRYDLLRRIARGPQELRPRTHRQFSRKSGPLTPQQVSRLFRSYGIQEPGSVILRSSRDFGRASRLDFPVACKLLSADLTHKKDVGGVVTGVNTMSDVERTLARFKRVAGRMGLRFDGMLVQEMVERGVELLLGCTRDPTFGPVVALGVGGTYTELIRNYSLAVAPVTPSEVRFMLVRTRLNRVLRGYRGGPKVKIGRLCNVVSRFSNIMAENPVIEQIEVNPLIATKDEILAVDARAVAARYHE